MPKRIQEDWQEFRDVVGGKIRDELKKYIKTGHIFRQRGKNGKVSIPIPRIDLPRFRYGKPEEGIGAGPGKNGDVVGKDGDGDGQGGHTAGQDPGDAVIVDVDLEDVLKFMKDELKLPNMKPKPSETFDEVRIKYNNVSLVGPNALLHKRRTIKEAMKREAAMGLTEKKTAVPGFSKPVHVLSVINEDKRYRQFREIKKPSANAVIFFARDGSGSMDDYKIDIVSDMAWWIESFIQMVYGKDKTESVYIWHDTEARMVSKRNFYGQKYGGGTTCSSAMKLIADLMKHRYKPQKYNIYVLYFGDGENWGGDNEVFCKVIKERLKPNDLTNFVGITQIMAWNYGDTLKGYVDKKLTEGYLDPAYVRTVSVGKEAGSDGQNVFSNWQYGYRGMTDEERDEAIMNAIRHLLGAKAKVEA